MIKPPHVVAAFKAMEKIHQLNNESNAQIYFSDVFEVDEEALEEHGAFNISLITDLPLFIDPFLLFNSKDKQYQQLHESIIEYMRFLKEVSVESSMPHELLDQWFAFPEVTQNWFGFSKFGNQGRGLGKGFAKALHQNFTTVFKNFGEETVTQSSHIEKLCLIRSGVGRDMLSDFTTNLVKGYLCEFTQQFARMHLNNSQRKVFSVRHVRFNYKTVSWATEQFELPALGSDYVLLTPKDILTRDLAWINRPDLINQFQGIADALPDSALRAQVNTYLMHMLPRNPKNKKEIDAAIEIAIAKFPQVLDYYVRDKENTGDNASSVARERVNWVRSLLVNQVHDLVQHVLVPAGFYRIGRDTYEDAKQRLLFLKDVIENKGGHKIFYSQEKPIQREEDLQILYRLTWFASISDASREVNDGRGPADYKVSRGAGDKTIIEFKLAKNTHLERNLLKQAEVYEKASDSTKPSLKAIFYFDAQQLRKVNTILRRIDLQHSPHIILIDARSDNKPSGSKA